MMTQQYAKSKTFIENLSLPSAVNKTPTKLNNDKILKIAASNAYTKTIGLKQHYEDEGINLKRPPV